MRTLILTFLIAAAAAVAQDTYEYNYGPKKAEVKTGTDRNAKENALVQPQEAPLAGNGIDQSLQFADALTAAETDSVLIGRLGGDILIGGPGDDVIVGGPEHANPSNRDHAFGSKGNDAFLWAPGDGSDLFDGGDGEDTLIMGLIGQVENGEPVFKNFNDQKGGDVWVSPQTNLPQADVTNMGGFCSTVDLSLGIDAGKELEALGLSHLVRFFARGAADTFERGEQTTDNGMRVTMHLRNVEYLVCTNRRGGQIEAFDLRYTPAAPIPVSALPARIQSLIK
jgi:Ca2+-binding RTX toxin-like protein